MFTAAGVVQRYQRAIQWELKYLDGVLRELERILGEHPSRPDVEIHVLSGLEGIPPGCDPFRSIVISLSEEKRLIPPYFPKVRLVFKQHAPHLRLTRFGIVGFRPANLFPLPLGYHFQVPYIAPKSISERTVDVFFSGSNWKSRRPFFRAARRLSASSRWTVEVTPTAGFDAGLTPENYALKLAETKIALSPKGFVSTDCFRLYEAMRAGCVVITVRQPRSWFTRGWPVIELRRWASLKRVVDRLLSDKEQLVKRQAETIRWWNEKCSEKAVAEFIARVYLEPRPPQTLLSIQAAFAAAINFVLAIENGVVHLAKSVLRKARSAS